MQSKSGLNYTSTEQVLLINSLDRDDLSKYMKSLVRVYEDSGQSPHDLQEGYNYDFLINIEKDWARLIVCTSLISYVRSNGYDPCSLWVSVYNAGGHLSKQASQ